MSEAEGQKKGGWFGRLFKGKKEEPVEESPPENTEVEDRDDSLEADGPQEAWRITNEPDHDGARPPAEGLRPDRGTERPAAEPEWQNEELSSGTEDARTALLTDPEALDERTVQNPQEPSRITNEPELEEGEARGFASDEDSAPLDLKEPDEPEPVAPAPKLTWVQRLRQGLSRSSNNLTSSITGIFTKRKLDDDTLEELEEALIMADLGVTTSARMVQRIAKGRYGKEVTEREIREALAAEIASVLEPVAEPLPARPDAKPQVVLIAGVNGVGKTTTIGKLAKQRMLQGDRVMMAACDTFRAAAVEQLEIWGERNGCPVMKAKQNADPAGLAFDALARAKREGYDLLLIDTAGRLHNKQALMDELAKMVRVLQKQDPDAPHDAVLILDATTGQNALAQVETFKALIDVSGLVVTKLDGTAKGGVVVALAEKFALPVHAVGVGEAIDDLRPFEARSFARGLLGLEA